MNTHRAVSSPVRLVLALGLLAAPAAAQFDYSLELDTQEREWSVEGRFENESKLDIDFWIARWTPGAYHVADYGSYVKALEAHDGSGRELSVERISDSQFHISAEGAEAVIVRYWASAISTGLATGDNMILDVESNRITPEYAYVTPVSLFGFVPGRLDEPFSLDVELPEGWSAATVMERSDDGVYHAPSFYRFEDSPLLFSPELTTVRREAGGRPLDVSVHGMSGRELDDLVDRCVRIAEAGIGLMGGAPYESYHFLFGFVPEGHGAGLEHSSSTLILANPRMSAAATSGLIAHEYFHLWCAERIHVTGIRNPDYTQRFETATIWVNESMTEYMAQHLLLHAGILDDSEFFAAVAPNAQIDQMAGSMPSQTDTSRNVPDWASMQDLMAFSVKMYLQGSRNMFGLDLAMRRASNGERGVVDLLRYILVEYSDKGRGFPEEGMVEILNKVAGGDLTEFYEQHVDGRELVDFSDLLGVIGCELDAGTIRFSEQPTRAQEAALEDLFSIEG
ncbi:MAG: putative metalloprotease with PDZ domain [Chlamydiales bacterium]|jgi:predicted metalloprotease with PDZ domain